MASKKFQVDATTIATVGLVIVLVLYVYTQTMTSSSTSGGGGGGSTGGTQPALTAGGTTAVITNLTGYPTDLLPGVNVVDAGGQQSVIRIMNMPPFDYPSNFTFMSNWKFSVYDSNYVTLSTTTSLDDTAIAIASSGAYNQVFGNVPITTSQRIIFSVLIASGANYGNSYPPGYNGVEAVGVGTSNSDPSQVLASESIGFYSDGAVWENNSLLGCNYSAFQGYGHFVDVAVDRVSEKIWYRVDGNAWQT